jgi:transcriptional regulator with XRE-family HTH domain
MTDIELGTNIRKLRELRGYTQQNLADEINISQKSLSRIENGTISPTFSTLSKISNVLNLKLHELLNFNDHFIFNSYTLNQQGGEYFAYNNTEIKQIENLYNKLLDEKERTIQILIKKVNNL